MHLKQLDVKTAFFYGNLEEDIYMMQPHSYIMPGKKQLVCKLKKSLYGLKQAPKQWYLKFGRFMVNNGFTSCRLITVASPSGFILLLYVNDMLVAGSSLKEIVNLSV